MEFKKYKIKGKLFSLFGEYTITDESDRLCYTAKTNLFQTKLTIFDDSGNEVLLVRRKFFSFRYTFFIEKDGESIFKIWKTIAWKPEIFIESLVSPDAFLIQGNIWATEYAFYRENIEFAYVSHKLWNIRGVYGLAVKDGEDDAVVLALVLIIDLIKKAKRRRRSS